MQPSDRIKQIAAEIAERNTAAMRQRCIDRGVPELALNVECKPDDPVLLPEAITAYLDEEYSKALTACRVALRKVQKGRL